MSGTSNQTRRHVDNEDPKTTMVNLQSTTGILTKNGVLMTFHSGGILDGKINTVTISDGVYEKVLTLTYDGARLTGFTPTINKL
jgi:hypothetical protein